MKVKIFRYHPDREEAGFSQYELPFGPERGFTVMAIIRYIYENLDSTLGFFSHCVCDRGICGRCVMKVNDKPRLACSYTPDSAELTIEPKNVQYFKDLVCKEKE